MAKPEKPCTNEYIKTYLLALLTDAKMIFRSYSDADYLRDRIELVTRLDHEGISFATRTLPKLAEGLLLYISRKLIRYPGFKLTRAKDRPLFLKSLFFLAYDEGNEDNLRAVEWLYNFTSSFKKLRGPFIQHELRNQLKEFVEVDQALPTEFNSEFDKLILDHARMFITDLFEPINKDENILFDGIVPRPGPGATNKPVKPHKRFEPTTIHGVVDEVMPYAEWFYNSYNHFAWNIPHHRSLETTKPRSRFKFVEKQVGKARGICIEENEMQYFQQGLKHFLYRWIESHRLTSGVINFTDQSINANLALISSSTKKLATLDMKEASDRISRSLVRELFRDIPLLADLLDRLSTREIDLPFEHDGQSVLIAKKFAPMGSGICFPVMSLAHYALIRAIIYLSMHHDRMIQDLYVYGDDIIVNTECVQAVYDCLPRFGMKFNELKSFSTGFFRESCGTHAYKGMSITPVYLKYTTGNHYDCTVKYSIIQNEYDLFRKGYYNACNAIRSFHTDITMTVKPASSILGWKRPQGPTLVGIKRKWSVRYQQWKYLVDVFVEDKTCTSMDDNQALLRWYSLKANKHTDFRISSSIRRKKRWVLHSTLCAG